MRGRLAFARISWAVCHCPCAKVAHALRTAALEGNGGRGMAPIMAKAKPPSKPVETSR